jgi:hypothetical protein
MRKEICGTTSSLHAINLEVKVKTVATPNFPSFNPMKLMGGNIKSKSRRLKKVLGSYSKPTSNPIQTCSHNELAPTSAPVLDGW